MNMSIAVIYCTRATIKLFNSSSTMTTTAHRKLIILSLGIATLTGASIFLWSANTKADTPSMRTAEEWSQALRNAMASTPNTQLNSKKDLIDTFCRAVQTQSAGFIDAGHGLSYTPQQSLFVTALCTSLGYEELFVHKDIIRTTERAGIVPSLPASCRPTNLENCDLADLSSKLFTAVMNDHSTLGIAWRTLVGNKKPNEIAKEFSNTYFGDTIGKDICKNDTSSYISPNSASNVDTALCAHNRSYTTLVDTINQLQRQAQRLSTIDATKLKWLPTADCAAKKDSLEIPDLFTCSYTFENAEGVTSAIQHNLRHNELMYYHVLLARLSTKLSDPKFQPTRLTSVSVSQSWALPPEQSMQIGSLTREIDLSRQAVNTMQQTITNFHATFPIHIGLRAYHEDVLSMRKAMAKIYTPVHQLYYKLRNVQKKE